MMALSVKRIGNPAAILVIMIRNKAGVEGGFFYGRSAKQG